VYVLELPLCLEEGFREEAEGARIALQVYRTPQLESPRCGIHFPSREQVHLTLLPIESFLSVYFLLSVTSSAIYTSYLCTQGTSKAVKCTERTSLSLDNLTCTLFLTPLCLLAPPPSRPLAVHE
jgi:hypothetical protein